MGIGVVKGFGVMLLDRSVGEHTQESAEAEAALAWSSSQSNCAELFSGQLDSHNFAFSWQVVAAGMVISCGESVGLLLAVVLLLAVLENDVADELLDIAQAQLEEIAPLCSSQLK
jgi:hypothetical protein